MAVEPTFLGKPLSEMTKEELIAAVEMLGKQLDAARKDNINTIQFMRDALNATRRRA